MSKEEPRGAEGSKDEHRTIQMSLEDSRGAKRSPGEQMVSTDENR